MTLYELAQLLAVTDNFAFAPRGGLTFCNCYSSVFSAARGVRLPPVSANDQIAFLQAQWTSIGREEAVTRANAHQTVVAAIAMKPHGHITPLVESPPEDPTGCYVTAAGERNAIRCKLEQSFGNLGPTFFTPKDS